MATNLARRFRDVNLRAMLARRRDGIEIDEAGFTLIEMMTVLLIMAVLLAIALPTFLTVTSGAKKTAAQSNITTAAAAAQAIYSTTLKLGTSATLVTSLVATQKNITFTTGNPSKGPVNSVSVDAINTTAVVLSAWDANGTCWATLLNLSVANLHTLLSPGQWYIAAAGVVQATCNASTLYGGAAGFGHATETTTAGVLAPWKKTFATTGVKT